MYYARNTRNHKIIASLDIYDYIIITFFVALFALVFIRNYQFKDAKQLASVSADNADRHWCEICQYRAKVKGCDYYLRTNKLRGCDSAECDKCVSGEPLWKINDT